MNLEEQIENEESKIKEISESLASLEVAYNDGLKFLLKVEGRLEVLKEQLLEEGYKEIEVGSKEFHEDAIEYDDDESAATLIDYEDDSIVEPDDPEATSFETND